MPTPTTVNNLKINKLTKAQYDAIQSPSETELYLVEEGNVSYYSDDNGEGIVPYTATNIEDYEEGDFCISDSEGNVLVKFSGGNIHVKHFTSAPLQGKRVSFIGDSITTYANYSGSNNPFYTGSYA